MRPGRLSLLNPLKSVGLDEVETMTRIFEKEIAKEVGTNSRRYRGRVGSEPIGASNGGAKSVAGFLIAAGLHTLMDSSLSLDLSRCFVEIIKLGGNRGSERSSYQNMTTEVESKARR